LTCVALLPVLRHRPTMTASPPPTLLAPCSLSDTATIVLGFFQVTDFLPYILHTTLISVHGFPSEPKASSSDADLAAAVAVAVVHAVRDGDHAASTFFKASDFLSYIPSPNIVLTCLAVLKHLAHRHTLPLWSSPPPLESDALSERPHPKP
jgi:hypothetical protein